MANIKSQKKRNITNEKSRMRNRAVKSELKTATRHVKDAVAAGDGAVYANGVDLSKWNGTKIDWPLLKESGIDFVILKVGSTSAGKDTSFDSYYEQAKAVGIDVGAYFYTYAQNVKAAEKDAKMCIEWLEGKQLAAVVGKGYYSVGNEEVLVAHIHVVFLELAHLVPEIAVLQV